jgi:hypothetical protein
MTRNEFSIAEELEARDREFREMSRNNEQLMKRNELLEDRGYSPLSPPSSLTPLLICSPLCSPPLMSSALLCLASPIPGHDPDLTCHLTRQQIPRREEVRIPAVRE